MIQTRAIVIVIPVPSSSGSPQPALLGDTEWANIRSFAGVGGSSPGVVLATSLWSIVGAELKGGTVLCVEALDTATLLRIHGGLHQAPKPLRVHPTLILFEEGRLAQCRNRCGGSGDGFRFGDRRVCSNSKCWSDGLQGGDFGLKWSTRENA